MKFKIISVDDLDKREKNDILEYVTKVHDFIKCQQKKLRKIKEKYKKLVNLKMEKLMMKPKQRSVYLQKAKDKKDKAKQEQDSSDDNKDESKSKSESTAVRKNYFVFCCL